MIPILYEENEKNFTSLGLGSLAEATAANIIRELNGKDELSMQYPVTGKRYSDIRNSRIIYAQPEYRKDPQPYRIYYVSTPLKGIVSVYARHVSEQRNYIPVKPFSATSVTDAFAKLPSNMLEDNPFTFWTDKTTSANFSLSVPTSLGQVLGGMEGSILDTYRGEYEFDKWTVKLWNHRGNDNGVTIRYGKNMTDFVKDESIDSTITGIVPYYTDADGNCMMLPEYVIESSYASLYPFKRTVPVDFSADFDDTPTEAQLRSKANSYMQVTGFGQPTVSLNVSFVHLSQFPEYKDYALLETVNLGDTVSVTHEDYNISVSARVVQTNYDCLGDKYKSVTIGSVKSSLETAIKSVSDSSIVRTNNAIKESASFVRTKVDEATKMITGVDGGYVVMHLDANNKPYELLIMDAEDINTAQSVWRFNKNGWGHSSTGYSGPYTMAATIDGGFVADFITAGTMIANRIKGGTLTLGGSGNSNGVLQVLDADGNVIGTWNNSGANITGSIMNRYGDEWIQIYQSVISGGSKDGTMDGTLDLSANGSDGSIYTILRAITGDLGLASTNKKVWIAAKTSIELIADQILMTRTGSNVFGRPVLTDNGGAFAEIKKIYLAKNSNGTVFLVCQSADGNNYQVELR